MATFLPTAFPAIFRLKIVFFSPFAHTEHVIRDNLHVPNHFSPKGSVHAHDSELDRKRLFFCWCPSVARSSEAWPSERSPTVTRRSKPGRESDSGVRDLRSLRTILVERWPSLSILATFVSYVSCLAWLGTVRGEASWV